MSARKAKTLNTTANANSGCLSRLVRRYHGWHWWLGISNELDCNGCRLSDPRWYAVHCWTAEGVLMAVSAHWESPMRQEDMCGEWGPEIIPPNTGRHLRPEQKEGE